jgi:anthranilate synthase component 1
MLLRHFPDQPTFLELASSCNVIPVCTEILADRETPVSLLQKWMTSATPLFLFESVQGGEHWGRYSFMGTDAHSRIAIYGDRVEIRENGGVKNVVHKNAPFDVLREYMSRFRPAALPQLPRFWGGLVGYITYETVSFFEPVPNRLPAEMPLARFFIPDTLFIFDNVRHTLQIVAPPVLKEGSDPMRCSFKKPDSAWIQPWNA